MPKIPGTYVAILDRPYPAAAGQRGEATAVIDQPAIADRVSMEEVVAAPPGEWIAWLDGPLPDRL